MKGAPWPEAYDALSVGILRVNAAGEVSGANPACATMLDTTVDALVGASLAERLRSQDDGSPLALEALLASSPEAEHVLRLAREDQSPAWVRLRLCPRSASAPDEVLLLLEDISERTRAEERMAAQHAVARILADCASLAEATPRILEATCRSLRWELGGLWRVDRDARLLRFVDIWHVEHLAADEFLDETRSLTIAPGVGLPGRAWASEAPVWEADIPSAANFPRAFVAARVGLHGAFAFPIVIDGDIVGVMDFFSREIRRPDADILQMFATIGSQIGQFIQRKRAEEDVRALAAQLSAAEDAERRRLARDIHDSLGQTLSVVKMKVASLAERSGGSDAKSPLGFVLGLLDSLIAQTRSMTFDLYPTMLDDLGLVPTLDRFGEGLSPLSVTVSETGRPHPLPQAVTNYLFRATKELLNNAAKHAAAKSVIVAVHWRRDGIRIVVADDGVGFDPAQALAPQNRRGLGLADLRERIRFLGGTFEIESRPGEGTRAIVGLPLVDGAFGRTQERGSWK